MAFAYVAYNSENRRQRRLTFEIFILAPYFTIPDVMPPVDRYFISRLAVPFQFYIFGSLTSRYAGSFQAKPFHIAFNYTQ